jgi:hypothetical protein
MTIESWTTHSGTGIDYGLGSLQGVDVGSVDVSEVHANLSSGLMLCFSQKLYGQGNIIKTTVSRISECLQKAVGSCDLSRSPVHVPTFIRGCVELDTRICVQEH